MKCEEELSYLDMAINVKKSACLRVGPRYNVRCNSASEMTYIVSSGALNSTHSLTVER